MPALTVVPNPAADYLQIQYAVPHSAIVQLSVADGIGRTVKSVRSEQTTQGVYSDSIDISSLSDGVYYMKVVVGNRVHVQPFIIAR
jgi:hypothetical protein